MKTILLTNRYEGTPLSILRDAVGDRFNLIMLDEVTQKNLNEKVPEADYLLVSGRLKVDRELLANAGKLKMIQRTGVGLDTIDFEALKEFNIPLYVNFGVNAVSVAEHAVMLILAVLRRTCSVNAQVQSAVWKKQKTGLTTHELYGKTVGIVGMGQIGRHAASILRGFGVKILYFDQYRLKPEDEEKYAAEYRDLDSLLKESDIVTLHCSLTPDTKYLINRDTLAKMKPGSILINTARGKLVDQNALKEAVESGHLMGAGIDTFEEEPIIQDNPLIGLDNVTLSPHIGGVTYEAFSRMMCLGIQNIEQYDNVNLEAIQENLVQMK